MIHHWIFHPERPVPGGLIVLQVLILLVTSAFILLPWLVNPGFFESPVHRLDYGLFVISWCATLLSFVVNLGWWIPFMVIGIAYGSIPFAWSGSYESYLNARMSSIFFWMACGGTIGACFESFRRYSHSTSK